MEQDKSDETEGRRKGEQKSNGEFEPRRVESGTSRCHASEDLPVGAGRIVPAGRARESTEEPHLVITSGIQEQVGW